MNIVWNGILFTAMSLKENVEAIVAAAGGLPPQGKAIQKEIQTEVEYFQSNVNKDALLSFPQAALIRRMGRN